MVITVATVNDYLGRLQRPEVSNQGTLQVVTQIAGMAKLVDALVLGTSAKSVGVRVPLPAPDYVGLFSQQIKKCSGRLHPRLNRIKMYDTKT